MLYVRTAPSTDFCLQGWLVKRRQTEMSTTKTSTNQNVDNQISRQTQTSTNQNVDTNRNVHKLKRRQTETSIDQNIDTPV